MSLGSTTTALPGDCGSIRGVAPLRAPLDDAVGKTTLTAPIFLSLCTRGSLQLSGCFTRASRGNFQGGGGTKDGGCLYAFHINRVCLATTRTTTQLKRLSRTHAHLLRLVQGHCTPRTCRTGSIIIGTVSGRTLMRRVLSRHTHRLTFRKRH